MTWVGVSERVEPQVSAAEVYRRRHGHPWGFAAWQRRDTRLA